MIQNEEDIFSLKRIKKEFVDEQVKEYLKCPFCGSFFIENNLCEMCGKISNYSPIKNFADYNSYYFYRVQFLRELKFFKYLNYKFLRLTHKAKLIRYKNFLIHRFCDLIDYVFLVNDIKRSSMKGLSDDHRKMFLVEIKDIRQELEHLKFLLSLRESELLVSKFNIALSDEALGMILKKYTLIT